MDFDMHETAIFFEKKSKSTVNKKGDNTISTRCTGSNNRRFTAYVFVARDGTKLL